MKRVALFIATSGGAGYSPIAPGTAGSAVGAVLFWCTRAWPLAWQVAIIVVVSGVGTWAASVAARHFGREDPGEVVIDEVAGQLVTLVATGAGLAGTFLGFFVFRAFDVVKPWPVNRLERLPGGVGIMADDLLAGVFGNLTLRLVALVVHGMF
jgi:phosphatidylglycerophosphatase A